MGLPNGTMPHRQQQSLLAGGPPLAGVTFASYKMFCGNKLPPGASYPDRRTRESANCLTRGYFYLEVGPISGTQ